MGYFDEVTKWKGLDQIRGPKRASDAPPSAPPASGSPANGLSPAPPEPPLHLDVAAPSAPPPGVHASPTASHAPGVVMVTVPPPPSAGRFRFLAIGLLLGAIVTVVALSPSLRGIRATLAKLIMPEDEPVRIPAGEASPQAKPVATVAPQARSVAETVRPAPLETKPIAKAPATAAKGAAIKGPQRLPDHRSPTGPAGAESPSGATGLPPGLEGLFSPESAGKGFEGASKALDLK